MRAFLFIISLLASRVSWSTKDVENGGKEGPASPGNDQLEDHFRLKDVVLDLANPNELVLSKVDDPFDGVGFYSWLPKKGYRVMEVMDGQETIWKASGTELCSDAKVYTKGGSSLLSLNIRSGNLSSVFHYDGSLALPCGCHNVHSGPSWASITEEEFNKRLEAW